MADKSPSDSEPSKSKGENEAKSVVDRIADVFKKLTTSDEDESKPERKLASLDITGIAKYVPTCKNIILMSGAGISTAAGIPDFRSAGTGLYSNLQKYKLPFPEAIFYLDFFQMNPNPFYMLCKELMPADYKPTMCHYFQRLLVEKANVLRVYTQNIDGLEDIAHVPADKLIYAHGSFAKGRCLKCRKEYSFDWMKAKIYSEGFMSCESEECLAVVKEREAKSTEEDESGELNLSIVKPDIVFFGESMPEKFLKSIHPDFGQCDLLIVMGSSLKVAPFNHLPSLVGPDCPRVLINREAAGNWTLSIKNPKENYRDVFLEGDCDQVCLQLAEALGWKEELVNLHKSEHGLLDTKNSKTTPKV